MVIEASIVYYRHHLASKACVRNGRMMHYVQQQQQQQHCRMISLVSLLAVLVTAELITTAHAAPLQPLSGSEVTRSKRNIISATLQSQEILMCTMRILQNNLLGAEVDSKKLSQIVEKCKELAPMVVALYMPMDGAPRSSGAGSWSGDVGKGRRRPQAIQSRYQVHF